MKLFEKFLVYLHYFILYLRKTRSSLQL